MVQRMAHVASDRRIGERALCSVMTRNKRNPRTLCLDRWGRMERRERAFSRRTAFDQARSRPPRQPEKAVLAAAALLKTNMYMSEGRFARLYPSMGCLRIFSEKIPRKPSAIVQTPRKLPGTHLLIHPRMEVKFGAGPSVVAREMLVRFQPGRATSKSCKWSLDPLLISGERKFNSSHDYSYQTLVQIRTKSHGLTGGTGAVASNNGWEGLTPSGASSVESCKWSLDPRLISGERKFNSSHD
eukprot:jgi/Bigna1/67720/fgenesh1_pg.4_\